MAERDQAAIGLLPVPASHLAEAVRVLRREERAAAAEQLAQAGALLGLEASHALGSHVRQRLAGAGIAVTELGREVAEGRTDAGQVGRVVARALLALSEHHSEEASVALRAKRTVHAGQSLAQAAKELDEAYEHADLTAAGTRTALQEARAAGEHLERDGSDAMVLQAEDALSALVEEAARLENALGARRR